jgi:diacylglycerol kinase family enzyme
MTCNGEYAVNICSVGLDARVGTSAATYKRLPLVSGPGSYLLSALVNVIKGVTEPYEVEINGEHISGDQTMICVASGQYYGGGFHPVPDADPADGLLDVLVVKPVSRLQIAAIIGKYKDGKYAQYPQLIRHYRTKKVVIDCPHETVINMDGELRKGKHIEIAVASEKMRFFYPKQLSWRKELQATL